MQSTTPGMVVAEGPGAEQPITRASCAVTAFVGRCLRGPVLQPVTVRSFADFQHVFGGLWQPSTLSYAVEQFFENGGRTAVVVRVVNGAAPATLSLPCGADTLTLRALSPGTREVLRASIDYDNVPADAPERFNLVLQRVRATGSERIEDQEIFTRLSVAPGTSRFVATALLESRLARVAGRVPAERPDRTFRPGARHPIGYVHANPDGDDGEALSDYDLIGSPAERSGLFALRGAEEFEFLCIPPLTRDTDLGPSTLLVAERLCRERRALLIVDPPADWQDCEQALRGLRRLAFPSEHALMCFPRVQAYDRLRGRFETFANCGAVAGALARLDESHSPWRPGADEELLLRAGTRPARVLGDVERARLANQGINPLQSLRSAVPGSLPLRTLAGGGLAAGEGTLLAPRRRLLLTVSSIERGTRWGLCGVADRTTWRRVTRQAQTFLAALAAEGVFGAAGFEPPYRVLCDERINTAHEVAAGRLNLLVSLRLSPQGEFHSFMISHAREGSSVRAVRSNWLPPGTRLGSATAPEVSDPAAATRARGEADPLARAG